MIEIILGIGVAAFIVYAIFSIVYMMSMKRVNDALHDFILRTEANANATLAELKVTLEKIRIVTDDIGAVTQDARQISNSLVSLEKGVRTLFEYVKEGVGSAAGASYAGLKAGIKAGIATFAKNPSAKNPTEKGSDDYEGEP
jgi:uncharacterized protein YoxC